MEKIYLVLVSTAAQLCGVEAFTHLLADRLGGSARLHRLVGGPLTLFRALKQTDAVLFNFPLVAWKRKLLMPVIAAIMARVLRRDVVTVLHEWHALDWKRRMVLMPVLLLTNRLCFSAPEIAAEFSADRISLLITRDRVVIPIPPNIVPPPGRTETAQSQALAAQRAQGRHIIGQFGSIYPKKQSSVLLEAAALLLDQGHDVGVIFVGSFIKGTDDVENDFCRAVAELGLGDRVVVTGYIANLSELAAIYDQIDVFGYMFPEGLTSRRGSVLAAALSGRPVVVNAPAEPGALDHHSLFGRLLAGEAIHLLPHRCEVSTFAAALEAQWSRASLIIDHEAEISALWDDVTAKVRQAHN